MATVLKEILRFKEKNPSNDLILAYMKEVFNSNPTVIRYEKGKPFLYFEYLLDSEESPTDKLENNLYYVIRNVPMEEFETQGDRPHKSLFDMFRLIETRKLMVSHIVCGSKYKLCNWLGLSLDSVDNASEHMLLGVPLLQLNELPEEAFVVCGSLAKYAQPSEIAYALKGTID